jgi:hypothetical protein
VSVTPTFVLDTNVFVEAARRYYAFDIAPPFWEELVRQANAGLIISIDRVKGELDLGKDELAKWANGHFQAYFDSTADEAVVNAYREIMVWANQQMQFNDEAKADFARADNADAWVVAYAKVKGCVVVTHEQYDKNIRRKIPIPNACQKFGIPYVDTFEMLRRLGVTFK